MLKLKSFIFFLKQIFSDFRTVHFQARWFYGQKKFYDHNNRNLSKAARQVSSKMCSEKRCFLVYIIFSFLIFLVFLIVAGFEDFDQENFSVWIQAKALRIEISAAALLKNDEIGKYLEQISLSI